MWRRGFCERRYYGARDLEATEREQCTGCGMQSLTAVRAVFGGRVNAPMDVNRRNAKREMRLREGTAGATSEDRLR